MLPLRKVTYKMIIGIIRDAVFANPTINSFWYSTQYKINTNHNIEYPVIWIEPGSPHQISEDNRFVTFNFPIIYADRLAHDRKKVDIHSQAVTALLDVYMRLRRLAKDQFRFGYKMSAGTITHYYGDKHNDRNTGAYMNISIMVPINMCDFSEDEIRLCEN